MIPFIIENLLTKREIKYIMIYIWKLDIFIFQIKKNAQIFFFVFLYIIVYINSNYKLYNIQNLKKFSSKILYTVNFCITLVLIISIKIIKNIVTTFVNNICRFSYNTYFPQRYFIILINKINNIFLIELL